MSRRMFHCLLWTTAVLAAFGTASQASAKPPDLPVNTDHTATPDVLPDSEWDGVAPLPFIDRPEALPLMAHLPPVQRRLFASTLLFGVHPLLTLVPIERLVDLPCDHPPHEAVECSPIVVHGEEDNTGIFTFGACPDLFMKCEVVPMPKDIHGTIEIGIGFSLHGAPTCKFVVTEFWGCGNCRKDETFKGCVEALLRALKRELITDPQPAHGECEKPMQCPWYRDEYRHDDLPGGDMPLAPSVLENLQKLAKAQELQEKGRRLAEDGFHTAARKCFQECQRLVPGFLANHGVADMSHAQSKSDVEILPDFEQEEVDLQTSQFCGPGVSVMVDGLKKGCYLSLAVGHWGHAVDLARQAYALDPERVAADPVMSKLHGLMNGHAGCCQERKCPDDCCKQCPDCPDCPCCQKLKAASLKPLKIIIIKRSGMMPTLPAVDPQTVKALEDVLSGYDGEEQEAPVFQKAIAKPYRETNEAPAAVGKGE
jgi:hypothetical protein